MPLSGSDRHHRLRTLIDRQALHPKLGEVHAEAAVCRTGRSSIRLTATALQVPPRGRNAAADQPVSNLARRRATGLQGRDDGQQVGRPLIRSGHLRGVTLGAAVDPVAQVGRIAQLDAARLGSVQGRLGALGDHRRLVFRDGGQDVDGQAIGLGEVDGHELDAALHQLRDESNVARQPVELGNHQGGAVQAAQAERPVQFGPVVPLTALDLGDRVGQARATVTIPSTNSHIGGKELKAFVFADFLKNR
jgi:hypothetical protein